MVISSIEILSAKPAKVTSWYLMKKPIGARDADYRFTNVFRIRNLIHSISI